VLPSDIELANRGKLVQRERLCGWKGPQSTAATWGLGHPNWTGEKGNRDISKDWGEWGEAETVRCGCDIARCGTPFIPPVNLGWPTGSHQVA